MEKGDESGKKIERKHTSPAQLDTGVICVFEDCRKELTYGAFQNHFVKYHLKDAPLDPNAPPGAPPVWWVEFRAMFSVGRGEWARLAKYGIFPPGHEQIVALTEEVGRLAALIQQQSVLLSQLLASGHSTPLSVGMTTGTEGAGSSPETTESPTEATAITETPATETTTTPTATPTAETTPPAETTDTPVPSAPASTETSPTHTSVAQKKRKRVSAQSPSRKSSRKKN